MTVLYRVLVFLPVFYVLAGNLSAQDYETENRKYPVPEHGELVIDVPTSWEVTYVSLSEKKPAIITFYKKNEIGGEIFQLNISVLWDDGFIRDITSPEHIRSVVENSGKELLQNSVEKEISLVPLDGLEGTGFYFNLTDAQPRQGEFRYLTQGAIGVGEVLLIFSLFTNDLKSGYREKMLAMILSARHKLQRQVQYVIPYLAGGKSIRE